jgi:uncharacterized DUF497 family protein
MNIMIRFEWNEKKNKSNQKKHGVWFEEAQQVVNDGAVAGHYEKGI